MTSTPATTATFIRMGESSFDPPCPTEPLENFEPLVRQVLATPRHI